MLPPRQGGAARRLADVERRLRQRERDLQSILDNMPAMIGYWDRELRNRFGNHAYGTWFGIDPRQMPGMHISEVIGAERYRLNLPYIEAVLRGEPQVFERVIPTPDGTRVRHSLAHYVPDVLDGEVLGFYVLVSEVTALKEAEAALREAHEQLEQRVVERTEQLRHLAVETTLAEERERQAIARDLHDDLGQVLHVAKLKFDALAKSLPAATAAQAGELGALIADASRQVRSLTAQLSPPVLRRLGLMAALRWLADEIERQYGLAVHADIEDVPQSSLPLAVAQSDILFRAVRELLINVAKHAGVTTARLSARCTANELAIAVADDGVGMNAAVARDDAPGFGLFSVSERVLYLGGRVTVAPQAGGGLQVTITMPLNPSPAVA